MITAEQLLADELQRRGVFDPATLTHDEKVLIADEIQDIDCVPRSTWEFRHMFQPRPVKVALPVPGAGRASARRWYRACGACRNVLPGSEFKRYRRRCGPCEVRKAPLRPHHSTPLQPGTVE